MRETSFGDQILSYTQCANELSISMSTFRRRVLPHLTFVKITERRRGVRRSVLDAYVRAHIADYDKEADLIEAYDPKE